MTIRKGDIVTIKPEFQDDGDSAFTWVARNDEEKGRVDISVLEHSEWTFWPMQTVQVTMLNV